MYVLAAFLNYMKEEKLDKAIIYKCKKNKAICDGNLSCQLDTTSSPPEKRPSITALPGSVSCPVTSCNDGLPAGDLWLKTEPFFPKPHLSGYFITAIKMKPG